MSKFEALRVLRPDALISMNGNLVENMKTPVAYPFQATEKYLKPKIQ